MTKELAEYIANYIRYEFETHLILTPGDIDEDMILQAVDAFNGGAR